MDLVTETGLDYFTWLVAFVGPPRSLTIVLEIAHSTSFYEIIPNDSNRVEEGLSLRGKYIRDTSRLIDHLDGECTVLEMLISLSVRMNEIIFDYEQPDKVSHWFWQLIDNLDLMGFTDQIIDPFSEDSIKSRFLMLTERTYRKNGVGGLFPLRDSIIDQRKVEIWYQMMAWLDENIAI